jgi:hypothetical protein
MENKLERLLELRKLQEKTETEIGQLVTELYSIIQPKKRKETKPSEMEAAIIYLSEISYFHFEQYEKAQRECWAFVFSPWLETEQSSGPDLYS